MLLAIIEKHKLYIVETNFLNIDNWIIYIELDNKLSNKFWKLEIIMNAQKTYLLKFLSRQHMGHACKQSFFGIEAIPSITCSMCQSTNPNTWFQVLLKCKLQHIHALIIK